MVDGCERNLQDTKVTILVLEPTDKAVLGHRAWGVQFPAGSVVEIYRYLE